MKRLLCVFAHPDDECYGPGGTIAQCALDGVEVFVLTFTCGEAGTIGVSRSLPADELCRRRTHELAASCEALGVAGHRILGAPDRGVERVDAAWAVGEVLADIGRYRPQVMITFHRAGVSGHPDHVAVERFVDLALQRVGENGPLALYEWGIPRRKARLYERPNLVPLEEREIAAEVPICPEAMDRKLEAIRRHQTQYEFFMSLQAKFDYRKVSSPECFALHRSRLPRGGGAAADLFHGIVDGNA